MTATAARRRRRELPLAAAAAALVVAACLPLLRVFVGTEFLPLVLAAGVLSVGVPHAVRRLGGGPLLALLSGAAGWLLFCGLAFLPDTLAAGVVPTADTVGAGRDLWHRGFELLGSRPAPTFAEPGLLFLAVTGVWFVAFTVEALATQLRAPVRAVLAALVLWVVPLAIAPRPDDLVRFVVPFLAAAALLLLAASDADLGRFGRWVTLLAASDADLGRFGRWVTPPPASRWAAHLRNPLAPLGAVTAAAAIGAGVLFAGSLPGFGAEPWYDLRGLGGGATLTSNPIVTLRANLTDPDDRPLLELTSAQPVYLRVTSLDRYSSDEEWTNAGIRGAAVDPTAVPFEQPFGAAAPLEAEVTVRNLPGAVLVPAPYQPVAVSGDVTESLVYDRDLSTFTLSGGRTLQPGERYTVASLLPDPDPAALDATPARMPDSPLTALPDDVPDEVGDLAREIVADAGALTPFAQALAIQEELRRWTYSLDPPRGHGGEAMRSFLSTRTGYCEQFAGTMAVMLRTLGIPARVAVGFTPGSVVGAGSQDPPNEGTVLAPGGDAGTRTYRITQSNAHAWVEVLFAGHGWIAFEPTPRADGDVLVPSAANLAPSRTLAQVERPDSGMADAPEEDLTAAAPTAPPVDDLPAPGPDAGASAAAADDGPTRRTDLPAGAALAALLVGLAATVAVAGRRRGQVVLPPRLEIGLERQRLARTARGVGRGPRPSETDAEWLGRAVPDHPSSPPLATVLTGAVYAPTSTPAEVALVRRHADAVTATLLGQVGPVRRAAVGGLAALGGRLDLLRARRRQRRRGAGPAARPVRERGDERARASV